MSEPQPDPPPYAALLLVAVAVAAIHQLPLFGVDREALVAVMGRGAGLLPIYLSPLAVCALGVSPRTTSSGGRALLISVVFASGWLAFAQLQWLSHPSGTLDVVLAPGMGIRLLVTLSVTAAHALLLWLAARLEGPRVHGLWWVVGVACVVQRLPGTGDVWWALAVDEPAAAFVYGFGLLPALLAATTWALVDAEHPQIRSTADVFGLALLPAAIAGDGLRWTATLPGGWPVAMALVLTLPGLFLAGMALTRARRARPLPALAIGLPGLGVIGTLLLTSAVADPEVLARIADPGPFYGEVDANLILRGDGAGPDDLDDLQARLDALSIQGTVSAVDDGAQLLLTDVSSVKAVLAAVLPRQAFSLRAVVEDGHSEPVDVTLQDCAQDPCRPMALGAPRLAAHHVEDATVRLDQMGQPTVSLSFTDEGRQVFATWSAEMVRKRIAIVVDDVVLSAPMVIEPITGGVAVIQMGAASVDPEAEARALAAALSEDPLQGQWSLASEQ